MTGIYVRRHIVVGAQELPAGDVDLILLPGEQAPEPRDGLRIFQPTDLDDAIFLMRCAYADHAEIASLGSTLVIGENVEWRDAIEDRLCTFIEDLGNCPIDSWTGALNALRNGESLASSPTCIDYVKFARATIAGQAAICLGSGPSAQRYLPEIKKNRAHYRIFCADSMLNGALDAGIDPDFVCFFERGKEIANYCDRAHESKATLIAPPVIDPAIPAAFGGRVVWWYNDELSKWLAPDVMPLSSGRSAGTLTVGAATAAGCNPIYLVGHDLSYAPTGDSHSATAHPTAAKFQVHDDSSGFVRKMEIASNNGATVKTNECWKNFRGDIELMTAANADLSIINVCGYYGAAIAGTKIADLPTMPIRLPPLGTITPSLSIKDPRKLILAIAHDCKRIQAFAKSILQRFAAGSMTADECAKRLAMGKMVGSETAWIFRYIFRSVYHGLLLRMHLGGKQSDTVPLLGLTLNAVSERILTDIRTYLEPNV